MTSRTKAPAPPTKPAGTDPVEPAYSPGLAVYLLVGVVFGIVITRAELISWFRIQEMFRFQGFHMYGIFATAIPVAVVSVQLIKRFGVRTLAGEPIGIPPKELGLGYRYVVGGTIFGMGWALTGACPGPLFALLGSGVGVIGVAILSALAGTWAYGYLRPRLPH